jgi:hypothetical protein
VSTAAASDVSSSGEDRTSKLFRKLRALMAQADSTPYEAERHAFEAKAQALMVEHGIDLAMLAAETGRTEEAVVRATVHVPGPHASLLGYLAWNLAPLHDCRAIRDERNPRTGGHDFHLIGWASDVAWLQLLVPRLVDHARGELRQRRPASMSTAASSQFARGFLQGYVREVTERMQAVGVQAREQAVRDRAAAGGASVAATQRSVALALRDRTGAVESEFKAAFPRSRSVRPPAPSRSSEGRRAGKDAGATAPIARHDLASRKGLSS